MLLLVVIFCLLGLAVVWALSFTIFKTEPSGFQPVSRIFNRPFDISKDSNGLSEGERILLNGEDAVQNGIYVWNGSRLKRAPDMCKDEHLIVGSQVYVKEIKEPMVLQVMPSDRSGAWMGITKGITFISMKEQVFGERIHNGVLEATDDGFEFVTPSITKYTVSVTKDQTEFISIPIPENKGMDTVTITVANDSLFWRATILVIDGEMRVISKTDCDHVLIDVEADKMTRSDKVNMQISLPEGGEVHVQVV